MRYTLTNREQTGQASVFLRVTELTKETVCFSRGLSDQYHSSTVAIASKQTDLWCYLSLEFHPIPQIRPIRLISHIRPIYSKRLR